jgi:hypothetical protein
MVMKQRLNDVNAARCCDDPEIWWGAKRETRTAEEVLVHCDSCGHEYPKEVIQSASDEDPEAVARRIVDR